MATRFGPSSGYHPAHSFRRFFVDKVALTGLQPSGKPHLGNYLGVIRPCMDLQRSGQLAKFWLLIADLHALTSIGGSLLSDAILELAATLVACFSETSKNLNQKCQSPIFLQSSVVGHTELAWVLASTCSLPRLSHLPQWKDKSGLTSGTLLEEPSNEASAAGVDLSTISSNETIPKASVGRFTYPVLQAADILLYGANLVPVGSDQTTHIELARALVRTTTFRWPSLTPVLQMPTIASLGVPKINSLRDPAKKMSKSDTVDSSIIYITDPPDTIRSKVKRAITDSQRGISYDSDQRPGLANLLRILAATQNRAVEELLFEACKWTKEELKSHVTDALVEELDPIRNRIEYLKNTTEGRRVISRVLQDGSAAANTTARERLRYIYSAIGCSVPSFELRSPTDRMGLAEQASSLSN